MLFLVDELLFYVLFINEKSMQSHHDIQYSLYNYISTFEKYTKLGIICLDELYNMFTGGDQLMTSGCDWPH